MVIIGFDPSPNEKNKALSHRQLKLPEGSHSFPFWGKPWHGAQLAVVSVKHGEPCATC